MKNPITKAYETFFNFLSPIANPQIFSYKSNKYNHIYTKYFNKYIPLTSLNQFKTTTQQHIQHITTTNYIKFDTKQQLINFFNQIK